MELIIRFFNTLNVILGWIFAPLYVIRGNQPKRILPRQKDPEILNQSATSLAEKIRTKQLTSYQVVNAFIERCLQVNYLLNAIVEERFKAALAEARKIDDMLQNDQRTVGEIQKETPLLGVPFTVKETCKLKGLSYTAGAKLRKGIKANEDGEAVLMLRKAGAIPIAVSNVPELCCTCETVNDNVGYTNNPYDSNRTCGGSSGGEASLISSTASVLGVGSDVAGSIRIPSLFCGIFGHKPTPGIVSNEGHFPNNPDKEFQRLLTIGTLCRYAEDLKLTLKIMSGQNANQLGLDKEVDLHNLKIYYMLGKDFTVSEISVNRYVKSAILQAVKHFQSTYQCTAEKIRLPQLDESLEICNNQITQIENIRETFNLKEPEDESSLIVELFKLLFKKASYSFELLLAKCNLEACFCCVPERKRPKYVEIKNDLVNQLKATLGNDGVLLLPTFGSLAFYKQQTLWKVTSIWYSMMVNILGLPATHVPMGISKRGLPVGFQVIAAPNQDRLCLAVAEELEKTFGGWVPPPMM